MCYSSANFCLIFQPLTDDASQRQLGTRHITATKLHAIVLAEIEFRKITVKVPLAAMLVNAFHAALENTVVAFHCVGVHVAAYIFIRFTTDALMARQVVF